VHQRTELVKVLDIIYGLDQIDDCSNVHDKKVSGLGLHVIYTYCYCFTVHSSSKKGKGSSYSITQRRSGADPGSW